MAGQLIGGRYEALGVLGQGGQGRVLRCLDHQHDRVVALKVRPVAGADARDQALREARVLLALEAHRNVAVVRDDFFVDGEHVLVMEHVDGEDLARRMRAHGGPLPVTDVLAWLGDVAAALDHLHAGDPPVVHGDVKPANVVVSGGRAVLVDFGLAGSGPRSRATRRYAAPELASGGRSAASDVYAFAATAHELLTGKTPEPGVEADWAAVPERAREPVRAVLADGLALDPDRRPVTAGALVSRLRAAIEGDVTVPTVGPRRSVVDAPAGIQLLGGIAIALFLGGTIAAAAEVRSGVDGDGDADTVAALADVPAADDEERPPSALGGAAAVASTTGTIAPEVPTSAVPAGDVAVLGGIPGGANGGPVGAPAPSHPGGGGSPSPPSTTSPPSPSVPTTVTTVTPSPMRGKVIVYRDLSMDVYRIDTSGSFQPMYHQDHFASWPSIIGIGDDLLFFYRSDDALNCISKVTTGTVADIDGHSSMSTGFTHVVDVDPGPGRVFVYRSTDGHSGSLDIDADGTLTDDDGYRFDLPAGYDRVTAVGGGRVLLYRSADGAAIVVEPRAADVLVQVGTATLPAGIAVLTGTLDGLVVALDGSGRGTVYRFTGASPAALRTIDVGAGYATASALHGGVVLHDPATGRGSLLRMDGSGAVLGATSFTTAPGAVVAAVS